MEWDIGQTYYPSYTSLAQLIGVARPDWYIKKRYGKQGAKACASHRCIHSPTRQKELLLSCLQCLIHATYQSATCYSFSQTTHVRIFSELSALCTSITAINVHEEVLISLQIIFWTQKIVVLYCYVCKYTSNLLYL